MGCPVGLSGFFKKCTPTYFCDFMSTNMPLGENFISLILMLMFSLSVTARLRASLALPASLGTLLLSLLSHFLCFSLSFSLVFLCSL